jgi:hypothetical protein
MYSATAWTISAFSDRWLHLARRRIVSRSSTGNRTVSGAIGMVFVGTTALDPTQPNPLSPRRDNSSLFDAMLNTLVWL